MSSDSWLRYLEVRIVRIPDFFKKTMQLIIGETKETNQHAKELTIGHLGRLDEQQCHMILENARKITLW